MLLLKPLIAFCFFVSTTALYAEDSVDQTKLAQYGDDSSSDSRQMKSTKKSKRKKKKKKKYKSKSSSKLGVGTELGWESTYGQSLVGHYELSGMFDFHAGLGMNATGFKVGTGADYIIPINNSIMMRTGLAFVFSTGTTDEITLEGQLEADDQTKNSIRASKSYELGSAVMTSLRVGGSYKLSKAIHLVGNGIFNAVLSGNELKFTSETRYEGSNEVTNPEQANAQFEDEAKNRVVAGGIGFSLGFVMWL